MALASMPRFAGATLIALAMAPLTRCMRETSLVEEDSCLFQSQQQARHAHPTTLKGMDEVGYWSFPGTMGKAFGVGGSKDDSASGENLTFVFPQQLINHTNLVVDSSQWQLVLDGDATARWLSWIPWLLWEQNLTRYIQVHATAVEDATNQLDDAEKNFKTMVEARDRVAKLKGVYTEEKADLDDSKADLKRVLGLAEEQEGSLCVASAAAGEELAAVNDDVQKAVEKLELQKKRTDMDVLRAELNASKAYLEKSRDRLAAANATAMANSERAEQMSFELQEAIRELNVRKRRLNTATITDPGSVETQTVVTEDGATLHTSEFKATVHDSAVDAVHEQAKVIARLTDNLTWTEIQSQKAALKEAQARAIKEQALANKKEAEDNLSEAARILEVMTERIETLKQAAILLDAKARAADVDCKAATKRADHLRGGLPEIDMQIENVTRKMSQIGDQFAAKATAVKEAEGVVVGARNNAAAEKAAIAGLKDLLAEIRAELAKLPGEKIGVNISESGGPVVTTSSHSGSAMDDLSDDVMNTIIERQTDQSIEPNTQQQQPSQTSKEETDQSIEPNTQQQQPSQTSKEESESAASSSEEVELTTTGGNKTSSDAEESDDEIEAPSMIIPRVLLAVGIVITALTALCCVVRR